MNLFRLPASAGLGRAGRKTELLPYLVTDPGGQPMPRRY